MSAVRTTGIVDLHHSDGRYDLAAARAGGIVAMIHKATEGKDWRDPLFARAMEACKVHGVLQGAYHFASASAPGAVQADYFLSVIGDRPEVLLALDLERNPGSAGTMSTVEAAAFVARVRERTGRWPLFYAGASDLRARVRAAAPEVLATLARCPLWLAQYGEAPPDVGFPAVWPAGWSLWQYTNGSAGPRDQAVYPRKVPGFDRAAQDRSVFRGTHDELATWWKACGR